MTIAMLVETVAWICCRIRWWSGLRYAMLRATIIANLMTVEGNNANNKLTHINAHYRKEIIQKLLKLQWDQHLQFYWIQIAWRWQCWTILLLLMMLIWNWKLRWCTRLLQISSLLGNSLKIKKNQFSLHFKYLKLIFYRVWV